MTAAGHSVAINLRLDVHDLGRVLLEPCNVDLNIEVTNAMMQQRRKMTGVLKTRTAPYFETIASSGMTSKCFAVMMSRLPVVVTKTLARGAASSIVVTS